MGLQSSLQGRDVYIVDGNRVPFLKAKDVGPFTSSDLAVEAGKILLNRQNFSPTQFDEVIIGTAMPDVANLARVVAVRLGCGKNIPAYTVMRNCASGMQALYSAALQISAGTSNLVLAGGTDAMSHAPLLYSNKMASWLAQWYAAKTLGQRVQAMGKFKFSYLVPIFSLLQGLTDPLIGLNMGQTAEKLAYRFNITREEMDRYALESHSRITKAYEENRMQEVSPAFDNKGNYYERDDGIRGDSTMEKLAKIKPIFDKKYGMVTAGNSSQVSDGAALLILASKEAVEQYKLPVMGRIIDAQWAGLDPSQMGLGPVHAATPILERQGLAPKDVDYWEINEAFAAQVIACLRAWDDAEYCKTHFNSTTAIGAPSLDRLNVDGGAVSIGHPIGASGARIVLHLLHVLEQRGATKGMAAICIGGGQGGAMYIERVSQVGKR